MDFFLSFWHEICIRKWQLVVSGQLRTLVVLLLFQKMNFYGGQCLQFIFLLLK